MGRQPAAPGQEDLARFFPTPRTLAPAQLVPHTERRPGDDHWELPTPAKVPYTKYQIPNTKFQILNTNNQAPSTKYQISST